MSINSVSISGNLGRDPELRVTPTGTSVLSLSVTAGPAGTGVRASGDAGGPTAAGGTSLRAARSGRVRREHSVLGGRMAIIIQDDMVKAAKAMPKEQGMEFAMALLNYGLTGEEPEGSPTWLPTFIACKRLLGTPVHNEREP